MSALPDYRLHGQGPTRLVALHGWFDDHRAFNDLLPFLSPDRFTVALLDHRGYGRSATMDGPYDVKTVADDAVRLADALGWDRFSMMGHSMGGKAALIVAARLGQRVERLVAITPVWAAPAPFDEPSLALFRSAATDPVARLTILRHSTSGRLDSEVYDAMVNRSFDRSNRDAFAAYFESWAHDDVSEDVSGLTTPTLVVVGAHDQSITAEVAALTWLQGLPNAALSVLADAGHYPMLESPKALAAVIVPFFTAGADPTR